MHLEDPARNASAGPAPKVIAVEVVVRLTVRPGIGRGTKPRNITVARERLIEDGILKVVGNELLGGRVVSPQSRPHATVQELLMPFHFAQLLGPPGWKLSPEVLHSNPSRPKIRGTAVAKTWR